MGIQMILLLARNQRLDFCHTDRFRGLRGFRQTHGREFKLAGSSDRETQIAFDYIFEQRYNFRYRVEFEGESSDLTYSMRVWADGSPEPSVWNVQYTDVFTDLLWVDHYFS